MSLIKQSAGQPTPKQMQRTTSVNTGSTKKEPRSTAEQIELAVRSWAGPAATGKKEPKKPPSARREKDDEKDDVTKLVLTPLELSGDRPTSPKLSARARSDPKERYVRLSCFVFCVLWLTGATLAIWR
jgi:hypothetical protein